jgi:hypothetical protein
MENILFKKYLDQKYNQLNYLKNLNKNYYSDEKIINNNTNNKSIIIENIENLKD